MIQGYEVVFVCNLIGLIFGQYLMEYPPPTRQPSEFFDDRTKTITFLREYDREASEMCTKVATAEWRYSTNSTDYNKRRLHEQQIISEKFDCITWRKAYMINSTISSRSGILIDSNIKRQIHRILQKNHCSLDEIKYGELNHVLSLMIKDFENAKICPYNGNYQETLPHSKYTIYSNFERDLTNNYKQTAIYCNLKLNPDLISIMKHSRSEKELRYVWTSWRNVVGSSVKNNFMRYLDLANQAARSQGFKDAGEQMRSLYDDENLYFTVQDLWLKIQPFYKQLFTFVRKNLIQIYGNEIIRKDGPLPGHILGDMWGENWKNIINLIKTTSSSSSSSFFATSSSVFSTQFPISNHSYNIIEINNEFIRQRYTPQRIFQLAEDFFTSLGLPPMLPEFWRNSLLHKSRDNVNEQCTPSAWDFCNGFDFRIKQCTNSTLEDFIQAHKKMTLVQYFMHYSNLPIIYRDAPNPAFYDAISNAIVLCISGPIHLQKFGLISKSIDLLNRNTQIDIEFLLNIALEKLPLMAFSLSLEKWRWHVFEKGPIGMNSRWWELSLRYMGIKPPILRTNDHFDPGAKYDIIAAKDYIKHFISTILEFQIFAEMCFSSGHSGTLHLCDFYRSREAGRILTDIMQQGASLSTKEILKILTRGRMSKISVEPLLEYFRPLITWLEIQNENEQIIGWNSNLDDVILYQPLHSNAVCWLQKYHNLGSLIIISAIVICFHFKYNYLFCL